MTMVIDGSQGVYFPNGTNQNTAAFGTGTALVFAQTTAPLGWTKSLLNDNKALRVVTGTVGSGGTVPFTTAFSSKTPTGSVATSITAISGSVGVSGTIGSTTLSVAQLPSHTHPLDLYSRDYAYDGQDTRQYFSWGRDSSGQSVNFINQFERSYTGGNQGHDHGFSGSGSFTFASGSAASNFTGNAIDLNVQYVDVIIAIKD